MGKKGESRYDMKTGGKQEEAKNERDNKIKYISTVGTKEMINKI